MSRKVIYVWISFVLFGLFSSCGVEKEKIPIIHITTERQFERTNKKECLITYYLSDGDSIRLPARAKYRGGMSSQYDKHSFSITLDKKYPLCQLPSNNDWILNANYIDKTMMRHKISYDLFREMNPNNLSVESAYVILKINNKYNGLYLLMEEIDASKVRLNKKDSLACLFKDPPIFLKEHLAVVQDSGNYYQQKYPKIADKDMTFYIEAFRKFIFESTDETFAKGIEHLIDIENVIDWHILLLLTNNGDGVVKNFYLYKVDNKTPFKIGIWDYDHSFGRDGDNEPNMMRTQVKPERAMLIDRLLCGGLPDYKSRLKQRWQQLRENNIISCDNILNHVNENDNIIKEEVLANAKLWKYDAKWYYDDNDYAEEIGILKEFSKLRIAQLDSYFRELE